MDDDGESSSSKTCRKIYEKITVFCRDLAPFTLVLFFMAMAQLRNDSLPPYNVVHDLGFDVIPDLTPHVAWSTTSFFASIVDIWVLSSYVLFVIFSFLWLGVLAKRRFLMCLTLVYAFRTLTLLATRYPIASDMLLNPPYQAPNIGLSAFLIMAGVRTVQTDYMFSGHTSVWTLATLFVTVYGTRKWIGILYGLFNLTGIILILSVRMHYTADILVAAFISVLVFCVYHACVERHKRRGIAWILKLVRWLDKE